MSNVYVLLIVAFIAGAMMPIQAGLNNRMTIEIDSPVLAALISFLIGTLSIIVYALITGESFASLSLSRKAPLYAWLGGVLGAFFVTAMALVLPRLGVALTFSLVIAGQMLITLVVDHFGLFGVPTKEVSLSRLGGILLIVIGVVVIRKF